MVGAILRFATLDLQSYRYDEAVTVGRVLQPNLFDTLANVPRSESTPPLYYLVAWIWSRPFGTGEVWMRSLSALAGTASIGVVYLSALALPLPRRSGLIAAAIVAVSPVLIWFSQDARAYSLVFLLTAVSFLFFARARRSNARIDLSWWAVFSALAIATHYFAGFVVIAEAVLLVGARPRRGPALAIIAVAAAAALLAPIALRQDENAHANWIAQQPLGQRLERAGAKFVGNDNGDEHGARQPGPIPLGIPVAPRGGWLLSSSLARRPRRAPWGKRSRTGRGKRLGDADPPRPVWSRLLRRAQLTAGVHAADRGPRRRLRRQARRPRGALSGGRILSLLPDLHA